MHTLEVRPASPRMPAGARLDESPTMKPAIPNTLTSSAFPPREAGLLPPSVSCEPWRVPTPREQLTDIVMHSVEQEKIKYSPSCRSFSSSPEPSLTVHIHDINLFDCPGAFRGARAPRPALSIANFFLAAASDSPLSPSNRISSSFNSLKWVLPLQRYQPLIALAILSCTRIHPLTELCNQRARLRRLLLPCQMVVTESDEVSLGM